MKNIHTSIIDFINEGLIKRHNISSEKLEKILKNEFKKLNLDFIYKPYALFEGDIGFSIDITNIDVLNNEKNLKYFLAIINNLGYYPTEFYMYFNNGEESDIDTFNSVYFLKIIKKRINELKNVVIMFHYNFEDSLTSNKFLKDKPKYLYHLAPSNNREKILKIGLIPKTNKRRFEHNERVYLFEIHSYSKNEEDIKFILNVLLVSDDENKKQYDLYKINTKNYIINNDPEFNGSWYFTYSNIKPDDIELIKKDLDKKYIDKK